MFSDSENGAINEETNLIVNEGQDVNTENALLSMHRWIKGNFKCVEISKLEVALKPIKEISIGSI